MEQQLEELVHRLAVIMTRKGFMLATAESCTGGWVAKAVTDMPGSSSWFERGFVTYHNRAKVEMLGVSAETLAEHGAVSEQTVAEMVQGAISHSGAEVALAISGIAGPGGGSEQKPVGTVCLAWSTPQCRLKTTVSHFEGDRKAVRLQAAIEALAGLERLLT